MPYSKSLSIYFDFDLIKAPDTKSLSILLVVIQFSEGMHLLRVLTLWLSSFILELQRKINTTFHL